MSQHNPARSLTEEFNLLFVRQADEYSCGPACLATVAKIYGIDSVDYQFFRNILNPVPVIGSCNFKMADVSREHLPFDSAGENSYHGGIAVANVMYGTGDEREGHYVVLLARQNDDVIFYDPYDHEICTSPIKSLEWTSESGHLKNWSINFKPQPGKSFDFWRKFSL